MKGYLIALTTASTAAALIRRLAPAGEAGKGARLGAGLLILLTALGPLGKLDLVTAAQNVAIDGFSDPLTTVEVDKAANSLMKELITEATETYILDKAQDLGMELTAQVETSIEGGYPVPWRVTLRGNWPREAQERLSQDIQQELGIDVERQEWICM